MKVIVEMDIDFELLKAQKRWLLEQQGDEAEGLIGIVDEIQDQSVQSGVVDEDDVFDTEYEEEGE